MLKKKQNTRKKPKPQTNSSPNNKTPKCNTTYPCTFLSHIDDVYDLLLSFVFNLNISVITFYKYPYVFPNIWLAATDFTPFYTVVALCDQVRNCPRIKDFSFTSLSLLSIICLILRAQQKCPAVSGESGRAKHTHAGWWKSLSNTRSCQTDEQFLTELRCTMKSGPRTNQI